MGFGLNVCYSFNEFYYSTVCHVCKVKSESLKSCKECKVYRYCSTDHQKLHWSTHKTVCKILKTFIRAKAYESCFDIFKGDWIRARITIKDILQQGLMRELTPPEHQIWMFPRVCAVCFNTNPSVLFDCSECPAASYCSSEHQLLHRDVHSKICSNMQLQHAYYCSRMKENSHNNIIFDVNIPIDEMRKVFTEKTSQMMALQPEDSVLKVKQGDILTHIFSIIETMQISGIMSDYKVHKEDLVIHIVGATYEYRNFNKCVCELMLHWVTNLRTLSFVFVGPELEHSLQPEWTFCNHCHEKNVKVSYHFETILYSTYISMDTYIKPNIIAIFNCGFHEYSNSPNDLWKNTLPLLLLPNIPLLITSYTFNESVYDLNRLKQLISCNSRINVLVSCKKNVYCSTLPLRDWTDLDDVYFSNSYMSIIKRIP